METKIPKSTWLFFLSFAALAIAGFWIGCLFTATETTFLKVVDTGLALIFLLDAAKGFRRALVALVEELEIWRGTTSFLSCAGPITAKPNNRSL